MRIRDKHASLETHRPQQVEQKSVQGLQDAEHAGEEEAYEAVFLQALIQIGLCPLQPPESRAKYG